MKRRWQRTSGRSTTSTGRLGSGPKRGFGAGPRRSVRFFAALIACVTGSSADAATAKRQPWEPPVPVTAHRENGVEWRAGFQIRPGRIELNLFNESADPIQCRVTLGDITPVDVIVHPTELRTATTIPGESLPEAGALKSVCKAVPKVAPPAPQAGSCVIELKFAGSVDDYYPPGPRRRREQGIVLVDFDFRYDAARYLNPVAVMSSGFSDLDNAALKLLRSARITVQGCVDGRARRGLSFAIRDDPPAPDAAKLPVTPDELIHVTAFRVSRSSDPAIQRE